MKDDSKCPKAIYCDFVPVIDDEQAQVECCKYCGKKVIYNKYDGRTDNARYLRDHIRFTAQPTGRTGKIFEEIYRTDKLRYSHLKHRKTQEEEAAEWMQTKREAKLALKTTIL